MAVRPNSTEKPLLRVTVGQRLVRAAAGFGLGWVWASITSLFWIEALAAGYGGLERGLELFKGEKWVPIVGAAFFASTVASWVGGTVGPVVLGPSRYRSPVLGSSLLGGTSGAALAAVVGATGGWLVWVELAWPVNAILPLGLGLLVGVLTGWLAGRLLTHHEHDPALDIGPESW